MVLDPIVDSKFYFLEVQVGHISSGSRGSPLVASWLPFIYSTQTQHGPPPFKFVESDKMQL